MIEGWWIFPLLGVAAGVLAGLLGIGGGLVLIGALVWVLPSFGIPQDAAMHAALASSLASIVLTASSSARAHHRRGSVLWPTVAWMVPGLLLGGWLGSYVAIALNGDVLRWCVAGYCFLVALQMAFGGPRGGAASSAVVPTGWPARQSTPSSSSNAAMAAGTSATSCAMPRMRWPVPMRIPRPRRRPDPQTLLSQPQGASRAHDSVRGIPRCARDDSRGYAATAARITATG